MMAYRSRCISACISAYPPTPLVKYASCNSYSNGKHPRIKIASIGLYDMIRAKPFKAKALRIKQGPQMENNNKHQKRNNIMGMFDDDKLVRAGLREANFRKFESFIEAATKGSYKIDPLKTERLCRASTFIVGMRDALRGWKLYGYATTKWPYDYDVKRICVCEGKEGMVVVENEYEDAQKKRKEYMEKMASQTTVTMLGDKVINIAMKNHIFTSQNMMYFEQDKNQVLEAFEQCALKEDSKKDGRMNLYVVKCDNEEQVAKLRQWEHDFDYVEVEKLNGGWYRIMY